MKHVLIFICLGVSLCALVVLGEKTETNCHRRNEVQTCVNVCPPEKTCRNKDIKFFCTNTDKKCQNKCVCKDGYFRNPLGDCISRENCDRCQGDHEYFSCGGFCDNICSELHEQNKTNCPIRNIVCNEKCYCEDEYARDSQNNCIPIKDCY